MAQIPTRPVVQSILRPPSNHCSSGSCRTSTTTKHVTFASDLTSYSPTRPYRPTPPSTVPPPQDVPATPPSPSDPHPKQQHPRSHRTHRHHHHRCRKHGHIIHAQQPRQDTIPDHREKDVIVQDVVSMSEAVARRQRVLDAGVSKKRTPVARKRGDTAVKQNKKPTGNKPRRKGRRPSTGAGATDGNRNENVRRRDRERGRGKRTERKPLRETTSRNTQVLNASVNAENGTRRMRRENKDARERRDDEKEERLGRRDSRDSRDRENRRENRENENEDRRRSKRVSSPDDMRRVRRSIARRLQLSRDDMTYSMLEPVHASVLYDVYMRTKGDGEEDEKLKSRMEEQERRDGRGKGSRRMLARFVGTELGRDAEMLRQLPRRVLVDRFVVEACVARMERLRNRRRATVVG